LCKNVTLKLLIIKQFFSRSISLSDKVTNICILAWDLPASLSIVALLSLTFLLVWIVDSTSAAVSKVTDQKEDQPKNAFLRR
jgi:hypothetical protein